MREFELLQKVSAPGGSADFLIVFGFFSLAVLLMFPRSQAASTFKKAMAIIGAALCFLAVAVNVAFILYATHLCRHMFDQLNP